jgi:hypothetical protein
MNLSLRQRVLATCVLAAGAAASVATSMVAEPFQRWSLSEVADLPPITVDESNPRYGFLVQVGFDGAMTRPSGNLSLSLDALLDPTLGGTASIHVEMVERGTDAVGSIDFIQDPSTSAAPGLGMPAWRLDCRQGCANEFEVWIERTDGNPALISGLFDVDLIETDGDSDVPPAGATLTLEVTPL